jgi:hypothetical protein
MKTTMLLLATSLLGFQGCAPASPPLPVATAAPTNCDQLVARIRMDTYKVAVAEVQAELARRQTLSALSDPRVEANFILAHPTPNPLRNDAIRLIPIARRSGCLK